MKKFYLKVYAFFIGITLLLGGLSGLVSRSGIKAYESLEKPMLTPPSAVFPIVWTVLYILMGIGISRVFLADSFEKGKPLLIFTAQLLVNFLWAPIFFNLQAFGFAFFWILLLWLLIAIMIVLFWRVDKTAAVLQIPYLLWVTFATYLTYSVWMLNR